MFSLIISKLFENEETNLYQTIFRFDDSTLIFSLIRLGGW